MPGKKAAKARAAKARAAGRKSKKPGNGSRRSAFHASNTEKKRAAKEEARAIARISKGASSSRHRNMLAKPKAQKYKPCVGTVPQMIGVPQRQRKSAGFSAAAVESKQQPAAEKQAAAAAAKQRLLQQFEGCKMLPPKSKRDT